MATKRDSSRMADADGEEEATYQPNTKRARNAGTHQRSKQQHEPATNATYGQRSCFPGIDENVAYSDEDLEFEDESDALAYLKSVRQEASGIPHLLVAPKSGPQFPPPRHGTTTEELDYDYDDDEENNEADDPIDRSIYTDGYGDTRGYYQDGAYTAAPDSDPHTHLEPADDDDDDGGTKKALKITEAYFASLRTAFLALRTLLHTRPPAHLLSALPPDHSPYVGPFGPSSRTFTIWTARLLNTDPRPLQLAGMDKHAAFRLLRVLLGGKFLRSGVEVHERTSRWVWALLARLPDRGELDHVEVGHVRELGKRAAVLMHSLRQMALLREEVELGGHDEEAGEGVWGADDDEEEEDDDQADNAAKQQEVIPPGKTSTNNSYNNKSLPQPSPPSTPPLDVPASHANSKPTTSDSHTEEARPETKAPPAENEMEDGEIDPDESVPMDMDGEEETEAAAAAAEEDMETAKARLLASLEAAPSDTDTDTDSNNDSKQRRQTATTTKTTAPSSPKSTNGKNQNQNQNQKKKEEQQQQPSFDPVRARMNMRATLNMILTVAGEFYGQRDLLEFRDPFRGI